jgi:superfamily II DNA or RNA helicase
LAGSVAAGGKMTGMEDNGPGNPNENARQNDSNKTENGAKAKFIIGQLVRLKSDSAKYGPVMNVQPGLPEDTLQVFIDNKVQPYYASQLETYTENSPQLLSADRFRAFLSALEMNNPGMASLHSINSARINFISYQYRPVLRFIRADRPRMLIADSVGVGKTIEAGLILRELQARNDVNSILIICPKPLVTESKWKNEMKRFDEDFEHLDGDDLRSCIDETYRDGEWPSKKDRVIVSYSKFNNGILEGKGRIKGLNNLDPPPHFDLVIVDEAHHIRNTNTDAYRAVKYFCENANAAIFLTATPIQLGDNDLFVLLNLLRPDLIIDKQSFTNMAEPNPYINSAISAMRDNNDEWQKTALEFLEQAAQTSWGRQILSNNPDYIKVTENLKRNDLSKEERVKTITTTENLHTFSGIINRTRRRDIGDFTVRHPETKEIPFTPSQKKIHDSLLDIQAKIFKRIHGNQNVAFMMTTIRRQAASCIFGLKPFLEKILTRHADDLLDDLFWDEIDDSYDGEQSAITIHALEKEIEELILAAQNIDETDPKFDELKRIIIEKQRLENHRVMLFSSFRHTLDYLNKKLSAEGIRVGLIHGGIPDADRVQLRERFEKDKNDPEALDVLLFSEVGCEGLDYQFCDCMVNYDLPWNPMRIEQRIGRIDRNGQKSESVVIYNMVTPETVDYDIYERCLLRIGVFEKSIGDCEEILGEITKEIKSIGEDFTLDTEQRQKKLKQLEDNKISRIQEIQRLENEKYNFIGLQLPQEQFDKEIDEAKNFYLGSGAIERLVNLYLQDTLGTKQELILGNDDLKTLRLSAEARNALLNDFRNLFGNPPSRRAKINRDWETWLRGSDQRLSITFESECANKSQAAFLAPFHPLVRQAAHHFTIKDKAFVKLEALSDKVKPGDYRFAIYRWAYQGIRKDHCLKTIAESDLITAHIDNLLKTAKDCHDEDLMTMREESTADFDMRHHAVWLSSKNEHVADNSRIIEHKRQSLMVSRKARLAVLNDSLNNNPDEGIRRMRQSEILKADADYMRHIQLLDEAEKKADIEFVPVVYGVLRIKIKEENDGVKL